MSRQAMDPRLDPARIDPTRGLERDGDEWTLFGLSLEHEEWLRASPAVQAELGALYVPPLWRPDDAPVEDARVLPRPLRRTDPQAIDRSPGGLVRRDPRLRRRSPC